MSEWVRSANPGAPLALRVFKTLVATLAFRGLLRSPSEAIGSWNFSLRRFRDTDFLSASGNKLSCECNSFDRAHCVFSWNRDCTFGIGEPSLLPIELGAHFF